jgi:RNA polymerase sigma-70 factor (ECF subfamily)
MPVKSSDPDLALIRAIAGGDERALDELYARLGPALLAYLTGQLDDRQKAEEVLQDVMLAAWNGAPKFRAECSVRTWLLAIARYRAINVRRRRSFPRVSVNDVPKDPEDGPSEFLEAEAERDKVRKALQMLPNEQRETLELIFYHGLSGPEAASVLGVAPGTIKSRLHRAKAVLRNLLRNEDTKDA